MRRRNGVFVDSVSTRDITQIAQDDGEDMEDFLDRLRSAEAFDDAPDEPGPAHPWADLEPHLAELPEVERLILEGLRRGHDAHRITAYLGLTPEAYRWRSERAMTRLRYLASMPSWSPEEVARRLVEAEVSPELARMVAVYWHTTSQTVTSRLVGRSQPFVSRQLVRVARDLREKALVLPRLGPLAASVSRLVGEGAGLRIAPPEGWQMPGGLTVFSGCPKAGATDLRDFRVRRVRSKARWRPPGQLSFWFADLAHPAA